MDRQGRAGTGSASSMGSFAMDLGMQIGSREQSHGEEQTHARGREGRNIPRQRGYLWD